MCLCSVSDPTKTDITYFNYVCYAEPLLPLTVTHTFCSLIFLCTDSTLLTHCGNSIHFYKLLKNLYLAIRGGSAVCQILSCCPTALLQQRYQRCMNLNTWGQQFKTTDSKWYEPILIQHLCTQSKLSQHLLLQQFYLTFTQTPVDTSGATLGSFSCPRIRASIHQPSDCSTTWATAARKFTRV